MKNLVLIGSLSILMTSGGAVNLFAQKIDNYGLKGGFNLANLNSNTGNANSGNGYGYVSTAITHDTKSKIGFYFGAYAEKKQSAKGSLVGEALISFQGAKLTQSISVPGTSSISIPGTSISVPGTSSQSQSLITDISITQLNLPIYYKYSTSNKFSIHGGGYLGLILGSKMQSVSFNNNTLDLGLLAGASYVINEQFSADVRYNFGLLKLDDFYNFQNRVLQLGVSYKLK